MNAENICKPDITPDLPNIIRGLREDNARLRSVCEELASALTGAKEYMYITSCPRDVFDKAQQALARYKDLV
jgi:hypothetical protein